MAYTKEQQKAYRLAHLEERRERDQRMHYRPNKQKALAAGARWVARNKDWMALKARLKRHGLTLDQFAALEERQGWSCAICECDKGLCIDHNHHTGQVRGLLCHKHNLALGHFGDNVLMLGKAINYLETVRAHV